MATLKEERRKKLQEESDKRGEETKRKKEEAASRQERTAREKGGRFRDPETGEIVTVSKGESGGRDISLTIGETLSFRDEAKGDKITIKQSRDEVGISDEITTKVTQQGGSTSSSIGFESQGEASAPAIKSKTDKLLGKRTRFDSGKPTDIGLGAAFSEATDLLTRPIQNIDIAASNFLGGEKETKFTPLEDLFKSIEKSSIKPDEAFLGTTKEKLETREGKREVIFSGLGEIALAASPFVIAKGAQAALNVLKSNKVIAEGAKLVSETLGLKPPKQTFRSTITEKIPASPFKGLAPEIGGELRLIKTPVQVTQIKGTNIVKLESKFPKQEQLVLLDVKSGQVVAISGKAQTTGLSEARIRGDILGSDVQAAAQQKKFDLVQIGAKLQETGGKPNPELLKAVESGAKDIKNIGTVKTFTVEQAKKDPALGRFLFSSEQPTTAPIKTTALIETTGGSAGVKTSVEGGKQLIGLQGQAPKVFEPIKKGKTVFLKEPRGEGILAIPKQTKFTELDKPTSTLIPEIRAQQKFIDPFSGKAGTGKFIKDTTPRGVDPKTFIGKIPSGKKPSPILETKTAAGRQDVAQQVKADLSPSQEILFTKQRTDLLKGGGGGVLVTGTLRSIFSGKPTGVSGEPTKQAPFIKTTVKPPQETGITTKITQDVTPKPTGGNLLDTSGAGLKFKEDLITTVTPRITSGTEDRLDIKEDFIFKITPAQKQTEDPIFPPPSRPQLIPIIEEIPPIVPPPPAFKPQFFGLDSSGFTKPSKRKRGFFGNVPLDSVVGIVRKAPEITISEGRGFRASQFSTKNNKITDLLGGGISAKKTKKGKKSKALNILGGTPLKLRL